MTMEMFNLVSELAIIVACFIGIDIIVKKVFEYLLNYQDKREVKALETVNKLFDKIPDIMMKTVESIEEYAAKKNESTFKEIKVERKDDDIDVEDILPY